MQLHVLKCKTTMHYRQRMLTYVNHCNNLVMKRSSQDIDVNSVVVQYEVHDAVCQRTAQPSGRRCRSWQLRTVGLLRPLSSPHKPHQSLSTSFGLTWIFFYSSASSPEILQGNLRRLLKLDFRCRQQCQITEFQKLPLMGVQPTFLMLGTDNVSKKRWRIVWLKELGASAVTKLIKWEKTLHM